MKAVDLNSKLSGKKVLITGGLGMIGSTIACKLVSCGAEVTIVDNCMDPYGSNMFNIREIKDRVNINIADIRDKAAMKVLVCEKDIIFNLASQVSHNDSMADPFLDAEINYIGHLNVLESLRRSNSSATILHAGSRLQYGKIEKTPVDEAHPLHPRTPYALNKTAAENMYLFYHQVHGIPCVLFRIANPYGPRSQMSHSKYSIVNWFIRKAMEDETISVYGDGEQVRDYIFVDDLAEAFIRSAVTSECIGEVFNVGRGSGTTFKDMVASVVETVGKGRAEFVAWPSDYVNVETGDYVTDTGKISSFLDWTPRVDLADGIGRTYKYYEKYREHYW